jgi:predicted transcriptional regulator
MQSRKYVDDSFAGSLPAFFAAFTNGRTLSAEEAEEIRKMIDQAVEHG